MKRIKGFLMPYEYLYLFLAQLFLLPFPDEAFFAHSIQFLFFLADFLLF